MNKLYDNAEIYDLLDNENRYQAVKRHWAKILEGKGIRTLLDVSIGTGSLTLPAAELGISLSGSDLSQAMLARCAEKARERSLKAATRQCDFRELSSQFTETFDCVASTGNSLPYVTNAEIPKVLGQMDQLVNPGGYLYIDLRNWDKILRDRKRFYLYDPQFINGERVNLIQVWDYHEDGSMTFNILYTFEKDGAVYRRETFAEQYYPVSQSFLIEIIEGLGYSDIQIKCHPAYFEQVDLDKVDWYCITARKRLNEPENHCADSSV